MQLKFPDDIIKNFNNCMGQNALWLNNKYYTFKELGNKTLLVANHLLEISKKEALLGILTHDTLETYAAILACWISGKGFVPISPSFPEERMKGLLQAANIKHVLTSQTTRYSSSNLNWINISDLHHKTGSAFENVVYNHDDVACMLFTSGSTGKPKGVPMTFKNLQTSLDALHALNYDPKLGDRCLQMFEFTFDMSLLSYLPAFLTGACVYSIVDDKYRFMNAFKIMESEKLTHAIFVPSTLAFMKKYFTGFHFPYLKNCMVGGEPFEHDLAIQWFQCTPNAKLMNISGPTETTMACMGYEVNRNNIANKQLNGILVFGKPWKNTLAIVVNENLEILPPFEKGELCFSGENVMNGYWNDEERNKNVFFKKVMDGKEHVFYRSGDGAYMDEEGDYYTTGRIDFQVKIQGYRVEPGEIESLAREFCGPCMLVAVPYQKHKGFHAIRLFVDNSTVNKDQLLSFLKAKLPPYMVPEGIDLLNKLPLNANGKIDRKHLQKTLEGHE